MTGIDIHGDHETLFYRAFVALAIGLLIGLERGWKARTQRSGQRVGGIRTFAILGVSGALWWYLGEKAGGVFLGFSFLAVVIFLTSFYYLQAKSQPDNVSVTSLAAAVLTFFLGGIAMEGHEILAGVIAIVVTLLLGTKDEIHGLLRRIERKELMAVLKFLIMTVIFLPVLPNRSYGPYEAFNPFIIWSAVVFIAGLSFVGYAAVRIFGNTRGIVIASLAGGLVSSTAVTLAWSHAVKENPANWRVFAGGIIAACAVMFLRVLTLSVLIAPSFTQLAAIPLLCAALTAFAFATVCIKGPSSVAAHNNIVLHNPLELQRAVYLGLIFAATLLLISIARDWAGKTGVYFFAALTGILDVDAATVSLLTNFNLGLAGDITALGIAITLMSNSCFKTVVAFVLGGYRIGFTTASAMISACLVAGMVYYLIDRF